MSLQQCAWGGSDAVLEVGRRSLTFGRLGGMPTCAQRWAGAQALPSTQPIPTRLTPRASHTSSPKGVFPPFRESSPVRRGVFGTLRSCK